MARKDDLKKWRAGLQATFPLVGSLRRKWAMTALEKQRTDRDVAPLLVEALGVSDELIAGRAAAALADLTSQSAIDALCALWAQNRTEQLGQIIAQRRYVASAPVQVRVLSGLKVGACDVLSQADAEPIAHLAAALGDADAVIRQNALAVLQGLRNAKGIDALCALWAQKRDEPLGQIVAQRRYVASAPVQVRVLSGLKAGACDVLSQSDAEAVPPLVACLDDGDEDIQTNAWTVLGHLGNPKAINALCEEWFRTRRESLEQLIVRHGYIATGPLRLRIVSALKCGKKISIDNPEMARIFVELLSDPDTVVRGDATCTLVDSPVGVESLVELLRDEDPRRRRVAATALAESEWRPTDSKSKALYLLAQGRRGELADLRHDAVEILLQDLKQGGPSGSRREETISDLIEIVSGLVKTGDRRACEPVILWLAEYLRFLKLNDETGGLGGNTCDTRRKKAMRIVCAFFGDYTEFIVDALCCEEEFDRWGNRRLLSTILYATGRLCALNTPISTNVLHLVLKKQDVTWSWQAIKPGWADHITQTVEATVNFEEQKSIAKKAINERGCPPYDPSAYLAPNAWIIT